MGLVNAGVSAAINYYKPKGVFVALGFIVLRDDTLHFP